MKLTLKAGNVIHVPWGRAYVYLWIKHHVWRVGEGEFIPESLQSFRGFVLQVPR